GPDTGSSRAVIDTSRAVPASAAVRQDEPVEEYYEPPSRTGIFVIMLAVLLAALVGLILYISATIQNSQNGDDAPLVETAVVPDVVNLPVTDAEVDLRLAGFVVERRLEENAEFEPNVVFDQQPAGGEEVEAESTVIIFVSKAAETERVPRLEGLTEEQAQQRLTELGLTNDIQREFNDQFEEGLVFRTEPPENAEVNKGDQVILFISNGPDQVQIPNLTGADAATASRLMSDAGFINFSFINQSSATVPGGQVIRSEPPAGQKESIDGAVVIVVSTGPGQVQVPQIQNLSREAATAALTDEALQLVPEFFDVPLGAGDGRIGLVVNTNPGIGSTVSQGSRVQVGIGVQAPETTTTAPPTTPAPTSTQPTSTTQNDG
ncbi:MAG: PASTA domain-containing protein, partial [Acidimicrobiales bacterium]